MLGAAAGAGYGYFYIPAVQPGLPARRAVNFAVLGGFVAFAYMAVTGD